MYSYPEFSRPVLPLNKVAQTAIVVMLAGTGSTYAMERSSEWKHLLDHRVAFEIDSAYSGSGGNQPVDVRKPFEHLKNIREILNPAVSDMAAVFGVSRQAVYKWLAGDSQPEPENFARVHELSLIADTFKNSGIERAASLLKMKAFAGRSLLDIVKSGEPWQEAVEELIAEAKVMEKAHMRSGLASSKAQPTDDWRSTHSIPAMQEDA